MKISSVFSYYGGKSKIINRYPVPLHDIVIEPFAGAGAYCWRWKERQCWINELDPRTFSIWQFLTSHDALEIVHQYVPPTVRAGWRVSDLVPQEVPAGLIELMRAEANQGTQGAMGICDQVSSMGARCWPRFPQKLREIIPAIRHWKVTNMSYTDLPNFNATWFVDPPYDNKAGRRYRQSTLDYTHLRDWCRERRGQVIVCENRGATWLPFVSFDHGQVSIRSRYQKANAQEVVWTKEGMIQ